jgi:ProP effector
LLRPYRSGADNLEERVTVGERGASAMSHNAIRAVISLLAEKWPCCFSIIESGRRPLKLGIRDDVLAALDGAIPAGKVSAALRWYVSSPEYQRRLLHGAWRVDLNGRPAGTVSQEDEAHARAQLTAIEAKRAECASASSNSAPAPNLAERMKQTSQAEQPNVPPAARLPPKPMMPPAPANPLTPKDVRRKRLAEHAERRSTKNPPGQIRAWRAP